MSKTKQPEPRMHSLELKGKGMERPTTAGVHFATADGLAYGVGSATFNPDPFDPGEAMGQALVSADQRAVERMMVDDIADQIAALDPEEKGNWTKAGPPKVEVLEAALGFQITEADRDNAWQLFKQRG